MQIAPTLPDIADMIEHWNNYILDWALILAAVAAITMALLEVVKALFSARRHYHERRIRAWLSDEGRLSELMMLAIGGGGTAQALFDQPTNKMMGQIQAAANTALDFPQRYPALYEFLTAQPGQGGDTPDEEVWRAFCERIERGEKIDVNNPDVEAMISAATRARARLDHFVARRLDAFQTVTEYRWARANQFIAVAGATIFLLYLFLTNAREFSPFVVVAAIFGGMMSPLAKDVVTALSDLRARRV